MSKQVTVKTSDPDRPRVKLELKATVMFEAELDPRRLDLGLIVKGERAAGTVKLITDRPREVRLTKVALGEGESELKASVLPGGKGIKVEHVAEDYGLIRRMLKIWTTSDKLPTLELEVVGHIAGLWEVTPRTLSFRTNPDGTPPHRTLKVTPRRRTRYRVLEVVDPAGAVEARMKKAAGRYVIDLTLKSPSQRRRGALEIKTTDPDDRVIKVKYYVRRGSSRRGRRPGERIDLKALTGQ